jgi:hypothetical protein
MQKWALTQVIVPSSYSLQGKTHVDRIIFVHACFGLWHHVKGLFGSQFLEFDFHGLCPCSAFVFILKDTKQGRRIQILNCVDEGFYIDRW